MNRPFSRSTRSIPPSVGGARPPQQGEPGEDLRCSCHRLLARAVTSGIELRCPRCKTNMILTWDRVRALESSGETIEIG